MAHLSLADLSSSSFMSNTRLHHTLGEEFRLCENGNIIFHWADFHETCQIVRESLSQDEEMMEDFRKREMALSRLDLIPIWIRTKSKVHQTTMHDLYERFIMDQSQLKGVDPFGPIDISFISGTGPFRSLAITECFNASTYKDFIMLYLISGKLSIRDFRLRLKSKVLIEYGVDFQKAQLIHLEQLTSSGILLSLDSDFFFKEVSKESHMRILVDTQVLKEASEKNLADMQNYLNQFAFNLMYSSRKEDAVTCSLSDFTVQSGFDFLKSKKVYLFAPYSKLKSANSAGLKNIENFVLHTQNLVRDYYSRRNNRKSA